MGPIKNNVETKPIDTNRTPEGRARNRRVEFLIIQN
jgi:flagellar motor protein MotB